MRFDAPPTAAIAVVPTAAIGVPTEALAVPTEAEPMADASAVDAAVELGGAGSAAGDRRRAEPR